MGRRRSNETAASTDVHLNNFLSVTTDIDNLFQRLAWGWRPTKLVGLLERTNCVWMRRCHRHEYLLRAFPDIALLTAGSRARS